MPYEYSSISTFRTPELLTIRDGSFTIVREAQRVTLSRFGLRDRGEDQTAFTSTDPGWPKEVEH
jgi:hypothetical protein